MSQYRFTNKSARIVLYGLDKTAGGYYWLELYKDVAGDEDVFMEKAGLTLSALLRDLSAFGCAPDTDALIRDFTIEEEPSLLQIQVSKMFYDENMEEKLHHVRRDLILNHNYEPRME